MSQGGGRERSHEEFLLSQKSKLLGRVIPDIKSPIGSEEVSSLYKNYSLGRGGRVTGMSLNRKDLYSERPLTEDTNGEEEKFARGGGYY